MLCAAAASPMSARRSVHRRCSRVQATALPHWNSRPCCRRVRLANWCARAARRQEQESDGQKVGISIFFEGSGSASEKLDHSGTRPWARRWRSGPTNHPIWPIQSFGRQWKALWGRAQKLHERAHATSDQITVIRLPLREDGTVLLYNLALLPALHLLLVRCASWPSVQSSSPPRAS